MTAGKLGIIGGIGPLAGAHFYRRLIELTTADGDSDHLSVVLISEPQIPSRRAFIAGVGPSPGPALCSVARRLEAMGCDLIAIPSSTTHAFYSEIAAAVRTPIVNLIHEVTEDMLNSGVRRPAVLSTLATREAAIYEPHFGLAIQPLYPPTTIQDRIEAMIDEVKRGSDVAVIRTELTELIAGSWTRQADAILLACTETPLIAPTKCALPIVSATDVLASAVLSRMRPAEKPRND